MKIVSLNSSIVADPEICHGKPTFKGTRVMVWQILELLETGQKSGDIYRAFPTLPEGAVEAALHYAAEKAKNTSYFPFYAEDESQTQIFA